MKSKKWTYGAIGSVSTATMRTQDLIPAFVEELRYLGHRDTKLTAIQRRVNTASHGKYGEGGAYFQNEESAWDLDDLFDMLDTHSLPYMYFGAHPGDGSDYGFWLSETLYNCPEDFDGMLIYDLSDIPVNYSGEVLHVNDHGNMTLYTCKRGKLREVWAVV